jgi:ABC-type sugar transport system substrate-binding protein
MVHVSLITHVVHWGISKRRRNMKRKYLAVGLASLMAISLTACGSTSGTSSSSSAASASSKQSATESVTSSQAGTTGDSSSSASSATSSSPNSGWDSDAEYDGELNIAVILKTNSSEVGKYLQIGAEDYEKAHPNIHVDVTGATSETSYDEQMNMIESAASSGQYDAIVLDPLQASAAATVLKNSPIPVISFDTEVGSDVTACHVGVGNEEAAKAGGEAAVAAAKEAGWDDLRCVEIAGVQGDPTNEARKKGYREGVNGAGGTFEDDEVQYADGVADKAVNCMECLMSRNPNGVAIVAANNDDMAIAAAKAASGNEAFANTIFLGFDGMKSAAEVIVNGVVKNYLSVACDWHGMTYTAVDAAVRAVNKEELPEFVASSYEIMDSKNAAARAELMEGYMANAE